MVHTIDCEECNEGRVDCSSDHMDSRGEHYTRDWTEECEHCAGTGHVDAAEAIDAEALFVGAATVAHAARRGALAGQGRAMTLGEYAAHIAQGRPPLAWRGVRIAGRWR